MYKISWIGRALIVNFQVFSGHQDDPQSEIRIPEEQKERRANDGVFEAFLMVM